MNKLNFKTINFLNYQILKSSLKEFENTLLNQLPSIKKPIFICTPNAEIILNASKNQILQTILEKSTINLPDSISLIWASHFFNLENKTKIKTLINFINSYLKLFLNQKKLYTQIPNRIPGVDFFESICLNKNFNKYSKFLLGASPNIAKLTAQKLKLKNPNVNIIGYSSNSPIETKKTILKLKQLKPDFLFVAYGSPKQEIWLYSNLKNLQFLKLCIGIGGSFDFISENLPRAPKILQNLGLEWVYRLIIQPSRLPRIFNATILFPIFILKTALSKFNSTPNNQSDKF